MMRISVLALLLLVACSTPPAKTFDMQGWFSGDLTIKGESGDILVYQHPVEFIVSRGIRGEHLYFGLLCSSASVDKLECSHVLEDDSQWPTRIKTHIIGEAFKDHARFKVTYSTDEKSLTLIYTLSDVRRTHESD